MDLPKDYFYSDLFLSSDDFLLCTGFQTNKDSDHVTAESSLPNSSNVHSLSGISFQEFVVM